MLGTWLRNSSGSVLNKSEYTYNDLDQRTQLVRTGGDYVDYTCDALGQLKTALGKESGGTTNRWHEQFTYAYDAAGNLTNRVQNTLTNSFTVNSLNQLTGGSRTGTFTAAGTVTSNATSVTLALNGGGAASAIRYQDETFVRTNLTLANGTNTFAAVASDGVRSDTNTSVAYLPSSPTFVYDSNGNLIFDGQKALEYDDENQLTWLTCTNVWRSQFVYDGKMRRRIRREFTWQNGGWVLTNEVRYIYDRRVVIEERDGFNIPVAAYTRGQDFSGTLEGAGGIGGLLAFSRYSTITPQHVYYHCDGNGNTTVMTDSNQKIAGQYVYDVFGRLLSASGRLADVNLYRFNSKEVHPPSDLIYYLLRYYDPNVQRWVTRDPAGEVGDLNLYKALGNSPPNGYDPFGLDVICDMDSYFIGPDNVSPVFHESIISTTPWVFKRIESRPKAHSVTIYGRTAGRWIRTPIIMLGNDRYQIEGRHVKRQKWWIVDEVRFEFWKCRCVDFEGKVTRKWTKFKKVHLKTNYYRDGFSYDYEERETYLGWMPGGDF